MESLELSREDMGRIAGLASYPPFLGLIKVIRQNLEPNYRNALKEAKTTEEKVGAVDRLVAFEDVFSAVVLYPAELSNIIQQEGVE